MEGESMWGRRPLADVLRRRDRLPPSSSPLTCLETPGSVGPFDVVTCSTHAPSVFVPAASFVWDASPYFVFKDLEQVPPFGSLP